MRPMTRRRFLAISAALPVVAGLPARASSLYRWRGIALGAEAEILLDHPDAPAITTRAAAEISRLEQVFSLYRADSALSQLNATGALAAPPFELLECLGICGRIHAATTGLFDPTVQPLWALYAQRYSEGAEPSAKDLARTLKSVGWPGVETDEAAIRLRPGMALTLNGIAQGFIADRIAEMLRAEGLTNVLVNTGEMRALGTTTEGAPWPVTLTSGGKVGLADRALASSSALGTTFDQEGKVGHILSPATGLPAQARWTLVSISAEKAAVADALSTAACLMPDHATVEAALTHFADARIEALA